MLLKQQMLVSLHDESWKLPKSVSSSLAIGLVTLELWEKAWGGRAAQALSI